MRQRRKNKLWSSIRKIAKTQKGRQAMTTTGAVIAAWYMGYSGQELFSTMHDATMMYAAKYPYMNSESISDSLWGGAKHFAASTLDYVAEITSKAGLDLSHTARETVNAARDFISRGSQRTLEACREAFEDVVLHVGGVGSNIVSYGKTAIEGIANVIMNNWVTILGVMVAARETYEYFQAGESIYQRWFKRGKSELKAAGAQTQDQINLGLNTALAGVDAILRDNPKISRKTVAERLDVDVDQIIWISGQLHERLQAESAALSKNQKSTIGNTPILNPVPNNDLTLNSPADMQYSGKRNKSDPVYSRKSINFQNNWSESQYSKNCMARIQKTAENISINTRAFFDSGIFIPKVDQIIESGAVINIHDYRTDGPELM